jgi:hypothetical protein
MIYDDITLCVYDATCVWIFFRIVDVDSFDICVGQESIR